MGNKQRLTQTEFERFSPNPLLIKEIESIRNQFQIEKRDFRVLDWGCGRGRFVLWLREHGYDAYGVDIDNEPFRNGADLFGEKGYDIERYLFKLNPAGIAPFEASFFHFVMSFQLLEHVGKLEPVVSEIQRVTIPKGGGFHIFPPHRRLTEGHLFMPFVHWIPKNKLRKGLIFLFVCLGVEPHWWQNETISFWKKVNIYYQFSIRDTFYRSYKTIKSSFEQRGFSVRIVDVKNYGRMRHFVYRYFLLKPSSRIIQIWAKNFAGNLGLVTVLN